MEQSNLTNNNTKLSEMQVRGLYKDTNSALCKQIDAIFLITNLAFAGKERQSN
jgi:hypothetical protein